MKKILLLCSAGMSTSIVVKKMKEAADKKGIEAKIEAHGLEQFHDKLGEFDIFLLGPQVRFKQGEFQKVADSVNKKVEVINSIDYGMMKGDKILDHAITLLG